MIHWNAQQPGGQGLASEFDLYFKALSAEAKEVFKFSVSRSWERVLITLTLLTRTGYPASCVVRMFESDEQHVLTSGEVTGLS